MNLTDQENGREAINADERRVVELLGALPRVDAPANFEFGVKARIATQQSRPQSSLLPFLKIAAPLTLVVLVAAFIVLYGVMPGGETGQPNVVASTPAVEKELPRSEPVPAPSVAESLPPLIEGGTDVATSTPQRRRANARIATTPKDIAPPVTNGGSVDRTQIVANLVTPPGIPAIHGRNANASASDIPAEEVLEMLGMKVELVKGVFVVRSVTENGVGTRAGVKANDVVEAINDQKLSEGSKLKGSFSGRSLSIRRDGKPLKLNLKN